MQFGLVACGEKSGGFQHNIDAEFLPRKISRVAFFEDLNFVAAHDDVLLIVADLAVEFTVDRVPLEQVGECFRFSNVVDRLNALDLFLAHGAQNVPTNASEAVDSEVSHK